jgi:ADP-ribose pyrophosphatase YjhB (NUDIX family)
MFDPRLRIIDTAFLVHVTGKEKKLAFAGDDAADTRWFKLDNLPKMGFHHETIIKDALEKMDNE